MSLVPRATTADRIPFAPRSVTAPGPLVLHTRVVSDGGGGPEKTILRSAPYAAPAQLRMAAAYIRPANAAGFPTMLAQAERWGCPLYDVPEVGPLDPRSLIRLLRLCKDQKVAIWHGHDYKSNFIGLLLRRFWPMHLVTTVHGWTWHTLRTQLYYRLDNICLRRYEHVVAVSRKLFQHCQAHGVKPHRLSYIPNGIDTDEYPSRRSIGSAKDRLGVPRDRFVIATVGRLSAEKGVDRAIRAAASLASVYPQVELHLIGDGPQRPHLRKLADQLGIAHRVHVHGWQAAPQRFYEMMDVLLLPSRTEGLPNVLLEAMAMGVPVAATDVGGVRDLLDDGRCGVILNEDLTTWAQHIAPLVVSPERRRELARRAKQRIESHFTFGKRMAKVLEIYEQLLEQPPHAGRRRQRQAA